MEVTAAYAMNMTCAAYHTIDTGCVCGQLQEKHSLSHTYTHIYTRVPHAYGGCHPLALAPKHRGRYVN